MSIFTNLKIVDLTRVFSGPFATRHFADFGAEVIKIEPIGGDDTRKFPPIKNNWSGYYELLNRNKSSLFLNLKEPEDLNNLYTICKDADVFVENYSPAVKKKLMIDYDVIKKINPKIIYASVNGISENIDRKYYDAIAQAESGLVSLNGLNEDMKISTSIVDAFSGMKLAYAISSALYYREKTGEGQRLSVSMRGSAFDLLEQNLIESSVTGKNPEKVGNMDNAIAPFGLFKTKNGAIMLAVGNDVLWEKMKNFLTSVDENFESEIFSTNTKRLNNLDKLVDQIEMVFSNFDTSELSEILSGIGIPNGPVLKMIDIIESQENYDQGLLVKINHSQAGIIIVPTGGIKFSASEMEKYKESPVSQ